MSRAREVARRFDRHAARYDNPITRHIGQRELETVRQLVPAGSDVLDFGCGTGRATLDHLQRGCRVTAFDLSPPMLAQAAARAAAAGLAAEWVTQEEVLAGRSWPVVTAIGVLDYYPEPVPLLRSLAGYLAAGGRLVLTFPNALSPLGWLFAVGSRLTVPATPRTPAFVRQALVRAGLRVAALHYAFPPVAPLGLTLVVEATRPTELGSH